MELISLLMDVSRGLLKAGQARRLCQGNFPGCDHAGLVVGEVLAAVWLPWVSAAGEAECEDPGSKPSPPPPPPKPCLGIHSCVYDASWCSEGVGVPCCFFIFVSVLYFACDPI